MSSWPRTQSSEAVGWLSDCFSGTSSDRSGIKSSMTKFESSISMVYELSWRPIPVSGLESKSREEGVFSKLLSPLLSWLIPCSSSLNWSGGVSYNFLSSSYNCLYLPPCLKRWQQNQKGISWLLACSQAFSGNLEGGLERKHFFSPTLHWAASLVWTHILIASQVLWYILIAGHGVLFVKDDCEASYMSNQYQEREETFSYSFLPIVRSQGALRLRFLLDLCRARFVCHGGICFNTRRLIDSNIVEGWCLTCCYLDNKP